MRILAIDPGTSCGWALRDPDGRMVSGVWDLRPRRHEGAGMRFLKLRASLGAALAGVGLLAYEEVRHHAGTDAAHIYGGIVATLQAECEDRGVPYTAIPVGTVKKLATGKGNADKAAMLAAARARWPGIVIEDDNQADAMWIAEAAAREVGAAATPTEAGGR